MYARTARGRELHFQVSGMLWNRSLVMQDVETESAWSHLLGEAMAGELKGERLEIVPSVITDWATWRRDYPGTSVLNMSRTSREFLRDFQKQQGRFVLGIRLGSVVKAYPFDALKDEHVVNDSIDGRPVVVTFDPGSATARIFSRTIEGGIALTFKETAGKGVMEDSESRSAWDASTGEATSGEHKGLQLEPLPGIPSFRKAWSAFHPGSEIYRP